MLFCNRNIVTFIILLQSVDLVTTHFFSFSTTRFSVLEMFQLIFFLSFLVNQENRKGRKKTKIEYFWCACLYFSYIRMCLLSWLCRVKTGKPTNCCNGKIHFFKLVVGFSLFLSIGPLRVRFVFLFFCLMGTKRGWLEVLSSFWQ